MIKLLYLRAATFRILSKNLWQSIFYGISQKQPPEVFCKKRYSYKFPTTLFKKETLVQVFSCEFWEISKNTFFTEPFWATAPGNLWENKNVITQKSGKANSVVLVDKKLALTKLRVFYAVNQNSKNVEIKKGF